MTIPTFIGPPTPDLFRRQVGRFGERHYIDPLPADDTWPALEPDADPWPSVTTVKKAWPFYAAKKWAAETVAEWAYDNVDGWRNFDRPTAIKLLADQAEHSLNRAGKRGTEVHEILYALGEGRHDVLADPAAEMYLDTCRLVIADLQPRWVASETVALSRTLGYGGTFDAVGIVEIEDLGVCIVDWKSRKPGKNGAYPEEGAQVAAYAACDYMIIAGPDGNAVRAPLPHIDHGLIVSIDPDGYECHLVDLEHATETWKALRAFWQAQRKSPMTLVRVGKVVGGGESTPASHPVEPTTPAGKKRSFGDEVRARTKTEPPEPSADPDAVAALERRHAKLSGVAKAWIDAIYAQAAGYHLNPPDTVRKLEIARAMVRFATLDPDDRLLRGAIDLVLGEEQQQSISLGVLIATLNMSQIEALNGIALAIHDGRRAVIYTADSAQLPAA